MALAEGHSVALAEGHSVALAADKHNGAYAASTVVHTDAGLGVTESDSEENQVVADIAAVVANIAAVAESNSENNQPTQIVADIAVAESDTAKQVDKRAAEQVLCPQCHRFPLFPQSTPL